MDTNKSEPPTFPECGKPFPPENMQPIDVMPVVLIDVRVGELAEDVTKDEVEKVRWPEFAASPPFVGEIVFSVCEKYQGQVMVAGYTTDPKLGPVKLLVVGVSRIPQPE